MLIEKSQIPPHLLKYFKLKEKRTIVRKGYISHLCGIFDLAKRVLKKTGTLWVVLDDSYAGSNNGSNDYREKGSSLSANSEKYQGQRPKSSVPAKSLIGIPFMFALEMMARGWILRNDICWKKGNPMPESVKDRFTNDWEHVFFFSQQQDYFFEQQFEPHVRLWDATNGGSISTGRMSESGGAMGQRDDAHYPLPNPQGRNKRAVWHINTKPFFGGHFAVFPPELVRTPILAGCPLYICSKCGSPRVKMYDTKSREGKGASNKLEDYGRLDEACGTPENTFIGYSSCSCGEPFVPGVVMDIFAGSGTVLQVALELGRRSIGIDSSIKYLELAKKRKAQKGMEL